MTNFGSLALALIKSLSMADVSLALQGLRFVRLILRLHRVRLSDSLLETLVFLNCNSLALGHVPPRLNCYISRVPDSRTNSMRFASFYTFDSFVIVYCINFIIVLRVTSLKSFF